MSDSEELNDLDAGGGAGFTPKRSTRPDLQEKMRRRFQHRNQEKMAESESDNSSPVDAAMGREGAFKRVPQGAEGSSSHQKGYVRGESRETPVLNEPDANGNFMFHDGHDSESGRSRFASGGQGRNPRGQMGTKATGSDHFDKALNSVLGELNRDEQSQRQQKSQGDATAVFENNFDDIESPHGLNIPAGGAAGGMLGAFGGNRRSQDEKGKRPSRQSHGNEADDEDDEMIGLKPEQGKGREPTQEMMRSRMGGRQNENRRADPLEALLGVQPGGNNGLNEILGVGRGGGGNPLAALMGGLAGGNGGERNDNDDPFAALLGAAGRDPLAAMMGNGDAEKNIRNEGNDFRTLILGERGGMGKDKKQGENSEETSDEEQYEDANDDSIEGKKPGDRRQRRKDPVRAMLEEMTKDMKGGANPLGAIGASGAGRPGRGRGGMGQLGGLMGEEGNRDSDPEAAFLGCREGAGESDAKQSGGGYGMNPLASMMGGAGRGGGGGGREMGGLAGLLNGGAPGRGSRGDLPNMADGDGKGMNPLAALMGGRGGGQGMGGNPLALLGGRGSGNPLAGSKGNGGCGDGGCGDGGGSLAGLAGMFGGGGAGGNPLAGMMDGGRAGGNPLAGLMGGGGAGGNPLAGLMGGGGAGGNPLASLMGGGGAGGNPLAGLMGGGGAGGNPLASLMGGGGAGGNPLAGLMGNAGSGGGGGGLGGLASMLGGGGAGGRGAGVEQMSHALAGILGGAGGRPGGGAGGGPGDGSNPMSSLMSSLTGGGRGKPGGDQEQLLRQVAGQDGADGEDVDPETADGNQIIQQLLAYEMMRAQSNRAPRAEQAMHTIIVVDTSGSMDGEPLIEAGQFISQFINGLEELQFEFDLQENVALVCVGGETQVVQHFTNDYRLIRRATDSLSAAGSSPLHLGLVLPSSLLSHGTSDNRGMGDVYQLGGHVASPRVIFISDGYPNPADDVPGQQPRPDDQLLHALQSQCVELAHTMTERTLCKVYCVPVGNSNLNFMEILADSTRGKVMQATDAKHMSRCLLHHVLVSKLQEYSKQAPTREAVAELLNQVTATAEQDDINGVFEVIREGEPDVAGRDQRVAQYMMQSMQGRGRARGGGGMQGLGEMAALMGQGQGQDIGRMPGRHPAMMGMAGRGGLGGGIPMMRGRRRPGGGRPVMGGNEDGSGMFSNPMLGMSSARGRGGGMDDLMRIDGGGGGRRGGGGGFENLLGIGGGGNGGKSADGLGGMGRGVGSGRGGINGMEAMMKMAGGGNGQGRGGLHEMMRGDMSQGGEGLGLMGNGDGKDGGSNFQSLLGMRGGAGECGQENGDQECNGGLEAMLRMGGGGGGLQSGFGIGSGNGQNKQKRIGFSQIQGSNSQRMLGMGDGGNSELGEQNEQGKSVFSHLPGGSLAAMLGMGGNATGRQGSDTEKEKGSQQSEGLGTGDGGSYDDGTGQHSMMGVGGGGDNGGPGHLFGMGGADEQMAQDDGLGLLPGGSHQALVGMGEKNQNRKNPHSDRDKRPQSQKNKVGASAAGAENKPSLQRDDKKIPAADRAQQSREGNVEAAMGGLHGEEAGVGVFNNIPRRRNQRGNGIFNTVPPQSFGIDKHGNPRSVDLMGDYGEEEREGDELMDKLASMLGIEDDPDGEGIFGADADIDVGNRGNGGGFLRGLPEMFGQRGGMAGGMPRNPDNQPPNVGGPPNMSTYLQNLGRDSRARNDVRHRDEDGDVVMGGLDDRDHSQIDAPFAGLGGAGGGNLPFWGGANRGQQAAPFQQGQPMNGDPNNLQQLEQMLQNAQEGNQGMPSLEEMLGQLGIGGMGHMPGAGGQQPNRGHDNSWDQ